MVVNKKYGLDIINSNATNQIRIISENFNIGSARWSLDGENIVFSSDESGVSEIYIMDVANEGKWKKLTNTNMDKYPLFFLDGDKKIIFAVEEKKTQVENKYYEKYRYFNICSMDREGGNIRELTYNQTIFPQLSLSPDEMSIVFSDRYDNNYEIFVMDKDGNNKKRLTYNTVDDVIPMWSPDGKKIIFVSDKMLYLMAPDGKNQVKLTDKTQFYVSYGICSPDSKKIAFVAEGDIYTIDIDGKNLKNLTNTSDWHESSPSWRPIVKD